MCIPFPIAKPLKIVALEGELANLAQYLAPLAGDFFLLPPLGALSRLLPERAGGVLEEPLPSFGHQAR